MSTTRCKSMERNGFEDRGGKVMEPALGTLDERLSIIAKRHGRSPGTPRATNAERLAYVAWLRQNDPSADSPYK